MNPLMFSILMIIIMNLSFSLSRSPIDFSENGWNCNNINQQSPIDIPIYNINCDLIYRGFPAHYINNTFYDLVNDVKVTLDDNGIFSIKPATPSGDFGKLYVTIDKDYLSYPLKEIRFHIYSEHTFEKMKIELEMQLIHSGNKVGNAASYIENVAISVFFSASWDTDSEFLSVLTGTSNPNSLDLLNKYYAAKITSMDLNQFFYKKEPYYYYTGSGTTPLDCNLDYHWFLMRKVQKMSWKQVYQLQALMYSTYPNGNARKIKPKQGATKIEYIGH